MGPASGRFNALYSRGAPRPEVVEVQEDLFMGKRDPPTVKKISGDVQQFLDWTVA